MREVEFSQMVGEVSTGEERLCSITPDQASGTSLMGL